MVEKKLIEKVDDLRNTLKAANNKVRGVRFSKKVLTDRP